MKFDQLDLNLLVVLEALIAAENVSVAAERVHLSQSAMSGALRRLREYFDDELLVSVGRRMTLTPKARELAGPVRAVLLQIRSSITRPTGFDPATSNRKFTIVASDFVITTLLQYQFRTIYKQAPSVRFDILHLDDDPAERLDQGDVDVLVTIDQFIARDHPIMPLFEDDYVAIVDVNNALVGETLTLEQFLQLGHVVTNLSTNHSPTHETRFIENANYTRRIEIIAPSFLATLNFVVGSNRVATMHRRLAVDAARLLPLRILELPFDMPSVRQVMQWNRFNNEDPGIKWLVENLHAAAQDPQLSSPVGSHK